MDKCPCCDRKFERIEDFPKIYLVDFKRIPLTGDIDFPQDFYSFAGPKSQYCNKRAPNEVIELFKKEEPDSVKHDGWIWTPETKLVTSQDISGWKKIFGINESPYDSCHYSRTAIGRCEVVQAYLEPYIQRLEGLVGKEVDQQEIHPPQDLRERYEFDFFEVRERESEKKTGVVTLALTHCDGGSISEVHTLAVIGKLAYEGRLNKHS